MVEVINADFITSAPSIKEALPEGVAEVAFLGRSNVGKSSLINSLANHKNLAKKSSTPGKTRLINFFKVTYNTQDRKSVHFVDLPGFGYAKVSKKEKSIWERNLNIFVQKRLSIRLFLHLVDARHPQLQIDKDMEEYILSFKRGDQAYVRVFTKSDKLNQKELGKLKREYPNSLMISNLKKRGIRELNQFIFTSLLGEQAKDE